METKSFLTEKIKILTNLADLVTPLEASITHLKDNTKEEAHKTKLESELKVIKKTKTNLTDTISENENKIKSIETISNVSSISLPEFGTVDKPSAEGLIAFCSHFENEQDNFLEFFEKLKTFSQFSNLSEKGFLICLSSLLRKDAFTVYMDHKEKPIKEIIEALENRFNSKTTIFQFENALRNFTRKNKENLASCMNRCESLINKTSILVPQEQKEARRIFLLQENLLKSVSSTVRQKIFQTKLERSREGLSMSYSEIFQLALYSELDSENPIKEFMCNTLEFHSNDSPENDTQFPLLPLKNYSDSPQTDQPPQQIFDQQDDSKSFEAYTIDVWLPKLIALLHEPYLKAFVPTPYECNSVYKCHKCHKCGTAHTYGNCPAFGLQCQKCQGFNHFTSKCFKECGSPELDELELNAIEVKLDEAKDLSGKELSLLKTE